MKTRFRFLGYYNQVADLRELCGKTADEIIDYWVKGYGAFRSNKAPDMACDIILEHESSNLALGFTKITTSGNYIISDGTYDNKVEDFAGSPDDYECGIFVDIYEKYLVEDDEEGTTYEVCPHCGHEVELKDELKVQKCPSCGKYIVTCSMCLDFEGKSCKNCPLCYLANTLNGQA